MWAITEKGHVVILLFRFSKGIVLYVNESFSNALASTLVKCRQMHYAVQIGYESKQL